jgi:hypothetical protein
MAKLGGMPLEVETRSGASFKLAQHSSDSWCQKIDGGAEIEVKAGSEIVVTRIPVADSYELAYEESLTACQKGLDLMAMTRGLILSVEGAAESHFSWWHDSGDATLRCVGFAPIKMDVPPVTVTVGGVAPAHPTTWDESFRYYRLSQVTSDLVEAYRNMFLMLESLLSAIRPQRSGEGENEWLRAALQEAHNRYDLSAFGGVRAGHEGDDLRQDFATDARHKINHAKRQRTTDLPLDLSLRTQLEEKLSRLASLCFHLSEKHLGIGRTQNFVFPAFFRRVYGEAFDDLSIILTSEQRAFDADATEVPVDLSLPFVRASARRAPEHENRYRLAAFARLKEQELLNLPSVARLISVTSDGKPLGESNLEEELTPTGIRSLEIVTGIHMTNVRANRHHYSI